MGVLLFRPWYSSKSNLKAPIHLDQEAQGMLGFTYLCDNLMNIGITIQNSNQTESNWPFFTSLLQALYISTDGIYFNKQI